VLQLVFGIYSVLYISLFYPSAETSSKQYSNKLKKKPTIKIVPKTRPNMIIILHLHIINKIFKIWADLSLGVVVSAFSVLTADPFPFSFQLL
jgi:hypothetical protein